MTDVIVIATPACFNAIPNWLGRSWDFSCSFKLSKLWTITNISSIPMPSNKNGKIECIGVYGTPIKLEMP